MNDELKDIIIFGSVAKGGFPKDIDIALVLDTERNLSDIKKKITSIIKKESDIQVINLESIYSPIWLTLIKEGFSVKKNQSLAELYRIAPVVLYKYSIKKLSNVQKVQFERGIKKTLGRNGEFLTRSVVVAPLSMKNEMMDFFKLWNIYYETREYELIPLLRKEEF